MRRRGVTPAEKDTLGRAILRELRSVERYLYRCQAPENDVADIALDALLVTYRKIADGLLVLPENPAERGALLAAFMKAVALNLLRTRRGAGDIYLRALRFDDPDTAPHIGQYTIAAKLDAWFEIEAQPLAARRFLLSFFAIGEIRATAKALRMTEAAANDALRRAQEHAQGRHRPSRGRRRRKGG